VLKTLPRKSRKSPVKIASGPAVTPFAGSQPPFAENAETPPPASPILHSCSEAKIGKEKPA